jgi:hypothetical protein
MFRFALLVIAIALCAPARLPGYYDCQRFSADEEQCDLGCAMTDDDDGGESGVETPNACSRGESLVATIVGREGGSSAASMSAAAGLFASAGVMGLVFRPPRN